jgi:hypothetical protein
METGMNEKQAAKQAALASKTQGTQYVVWVFDEGRNVYDAEQAKRYAPLIHIEAVYVAGVKVDLEVAA